MSDSNLEDCPLCGSSATMMTWNRPGIEFMAWGQIKCTNPTCGCTMPAWNDIRTVSRMEFVNEQKSIQRWNERQYEISN